MWPPFSWVVFLWQWGRLLLPTSLPPAVPGTFQTRPDSLLNAALNRLIFLAFDVDILFLFPVALAYDKGFVIRDFVEIVIFVGILSLALVYAWKKGVFKWERKTYSPR
jgi:hypothetical protein